MEKKSVWHLNPDFIFEFIDSKLTVFDAEKSFLYTFNETASYIFKLLKKNNSKQQIIEKIKKRYKVTEARAKADFEALIGKMRQMKIIT